MAITVRLHPEGGDEGVPLLAVTADDFAEFIEKYRGWVSPDGMFLATDEVVERGREVDCVCHMEDGYELLRARCLVAWARPAGDSLRRPPGIGLHFLKIADTSKPLVAKMVENQTLTGGEVFSVDRERPSRGDQAAPDAQRLHRMMKDQGARQEVEALGSGRIDPVQELEVGKSLAPGLDIEMGRGQGEGGQERSSREFRAPVPQRVLDTLNQEEARKEKAVAAASGEPKADELSTRSARRDSTAQSKSSSWRRGSEAERTGSASPGEADGSRQASETPRRELEGLRDESGSTPEIEFREAPRFDPLKDRPIAPDSQPNEAADEVVAQGAESGSEQLRLDPTLLASNEFDPRGGHGVRVRWRWVFWPLLGLVALAMLWWVLAPADHPWSLRYRLASSDGSTQDDGLDAAASTEVQTEQARRVLEARLEELDDQSVLTLVFDGELSADRVADLRLPSGGPRYVFKISGILVPPAALDPASTTHVQQVRFGMHRIGEESQLHVVLDLTGTDVQLVGSRVLGDRLRVRLTAP